jgi:sarcosine oxidase subunit beta
VTSTRQLPPTADAVVVGGGTIGAWCAWFLKLSGLRRVVLVEAGRLGKGASSRAAGMVRAQGGTESAVRLGLYSRDFYRQQHELLGIDSGFVEQGYFMPCFNEAEVAQAHTRIAMQNKLGLDARWVSSDEFDAMNPVVTPGMTLGSSFAADDGYIDAPSNVLAYTAALFTAGVEVFERTAFTGMATTAGQVTADGVRRGVGDLLAARGGRAALGDEQPRRAAGSQP